MFLSSFTFVLPLIAIVISAPILPTTRSLSSITINESTIIFGQNSTVNSPATDSSSELNATESNKKSTHNRHNAMLTWWQAMLILAAEILLFCTVIAIFVTLLQIFRPVPIVAKRKNSYLGGENQRNKLPSPIVGQKCANNKQTIGLEKKKETSTSKLSSLVTAGRNVESKRSEQT